MIVDISDYDFRSIMKDESLYLPIRWNGSDFSTILEDLFHYYIHKLEILDNTKKCPSIHMDVGRIKEVCRLLIKSVNHYLNGFPSKAYASFEQVMDALMREPLKIYEKSVMEQFEESNDPLELFRVVRVNDNQPYSRTRVFHTPYNLRSKVSTSRYSIAGFPSLYLGTTLALCCEEIHMNNNDFALASRFKLERKYEYARSEIKVIELGIKPQDFVQDFDHEQRRYNYERNATQDFDHEQRRYNYKRNAREIREELLIGDDVKSAYLLWYPLIASCSYIRTNKSDPFAAEYIIPQLLMQWVRNEICFYGDDGYNELVGIRYFSCASVRASDMGFNYVFPASGGMISPQLPYCPVLSRAFQLTRPIYIHDYDSLYDCERKLIETMDFDYIDSIP